MSCIGARTCLAIVLCLLFGTSVRWCIADESGRRSGKEWVEAGREAWQPESSDPWYDVEQDDLKPMTLPWKWPEWLNVKWIGLSLEAFLWGLVVVVIALLIFWAIHAARQRNPVVLTPIRHAAERSLEVEQIEALPFMNDRSHSNLLGQARRYYQEGNYSEAIIYLFSHELVELDRFALIHLAKGKTNRQYLRETGRVEPLKRLMETTVNAFEGVFFGGRPLDRAGFEACWNRLAEFDQLVSQTAP